MSNTVLVMGSFVADLAFRAARLPAWGETLMGDVLRARPRRQRLQPGRRRRARRCMPSASCPSSATMPSAASPATCGLRTASTPRSSALATRPPAPPPSSSTPRAAKTPSSSSPAPASRSPPQKSMPQPTPSAPPPSSSRSSSFRSTPSQRGLEIARAAGVTTILNPAPAPDLAAAGLPHRARRLLRPQRNRSRAPHRPARRDHRSKPSAPPTALLARGARNVILTLGGRGSLLRTAAGQSTRHPRLQRRPSARNHRRGRRLLRRLRRRARRRPHRRSCRAFRVRHCRHLGHAARHGALDAHARRNRSAARKVSLTQTTTPAAPRHELRTPAATYALRPCIRA